MDLNKAVMSLEKYKRSHVQILGVLSHEVKPNQWNSFTNVTFGDPGRFFKSNYHNSALIPNFLSSFSCFVFHFPCFSLFVFISHHSILVLYLQVHVLGEGLWLSYHGDILAVKEVAALHCY